MSNGFSKKVGQKAQDLARQVGRQALAEQKEYVDTAKKQLGVEFTPPQPPGPSLVDEIVTGPGVTTNVSSKEHSNIHTQERKRLQELEEELRQAHQQESARLASWQKAQQEVLSPPQSQEAKPLAEPTPHRKVGVLGGIAQKAKGGMEIMRGKK